MANMGIFRIARNALSILTSDVFNRTTTFLIYLLIARYLGAFEFGQMSLALTLFYTFQVLAAAGLKTLLTREIAKDKAQSERYLMNATLVVTVFSILSLLILFGFTHLMGYQRETATIILLLCIGLLPYSLVSICEGVFQAWERMHFIAYANVPANIVKLVAAYLLLSNSYGIFYIVLLMLCCYLGVMIVEWWFILNYFIKPRLKFSLRFSIALIKKTFPFLGIDSIIAIWSGLNILILSKMTQEIEVGLYSAAVQITVPIRLVYQSIAMSVFPVLSRLFTANSDGFRRVSQEVVELLLFLSLPSAVGLFYLADAVLLTLYGEKEFLQASKILRIVVWGLIPAALTTSLGQVLLAGLKEKVTLRIVAFNLLANLVFGIVLINLFGLGGAAATALIIGIINFFQHYYPVSKMLKNLNLFKIVWKPALASTLMGIYLALAESQGLLLTIVSSAVVYLSSLTVLLIWSHGGLWQLRAKYQKLLPK